MRRGTASVSVRSRGTTSAQPKASTKSLFNSKPSTSILKKATFASSKSTAVVRSNFKSTSLKSSSSSIFSSRPALQKRTYFFPATKKLLSQAVGEFYTASSETFGQYNDSDKLDDLKLKIEPQLEKYYRHKYLFNTIDDIDDFMELPNDAKQHCFDHHMVNMQVFIPYMSILHFGVSPDGQVPEETQQWVHTLASAITAGAFNYMNKAQRAATADEITEKFTKAMTIQGAEVPDAVWNPANLFESNHDVFMDRVRAENVLRVNGYEPKEINEVIDTCVLSPGFRTLEWALPSPPPEHTWEEPPIIKEVDDSTEH